MDSRSPGFTPPLGFGEFTSGIEVTPYKLTVTLLLLLLGLAKAVLSYKDHIFASITLDLLLCITGVATVYWVGDLENSELQIWPWFFRKDILSGKLRQYRDSEEADHFMEMGVINPPLHSYPLFKITRHKLFSTIIVSLAVSVKIFYSYRGNLVISMTMDWLIGIPLTIILYWVGLYENVRPAVATEYFHRDLLTGKMVIPNIHPADSLDHAANIKIRAKPSFLVRKTLYRLLNTISLFAFGFLKAIMAYLGHSIVPTTLEMVVGTFFAIALYWMSFWEPPRARGNEIFFHTDFSRFIPSLGKTLIIIFFIFFIGFHIFGTFSFARNVVTSSEYDNEADKIARTILCTWWAMSLTGFLIYFINLIHERRRRLGYERLGFRPSEMLWPLLGWYVANFGIVWVGGLIKATAGNVPSFKGDFSGTSPKLPNGGGWHWQVGFGGFRVGGEFGSGNNFVGGIACS